MVRGLGAVRRILPVVRFTRTAGFSLPGWPFQTLTHVSTRTRTPNPQRLPRRSRERVGR